MSLLNLSEADRDQLGQLNTEGNRASWRRGTSVPEKNGTSDDDEPEPSSSLQDAGLIDEKLEDDKPPPDVCSSTYILFVVLGSGLLFPWNAIIQAIDFFMAVFPGSMIETQLAIAYMTTTMFTMVAILIFNKIFNVDPRWKLVIGFVLMLLSIVVFTIMGKGITIWMCILMTVVAGIGDGLAQMALYGLVAALPPRYTGGVMIGNGISGIIVSMLKVATKVSFEENMTGLLNASRVFFGISTFFCLMCIAAVVVVQYLPVVRYYRRLEAESKAAKPDANADQEQNTQNPMSEASVADVSSYKEKVTKAKGFSYFSILCKMRHPAVCVMGNFALTLAVYPGLTLAIPSAAGLREGWFPVALVATFNCMDFLGRWVLRWEVLVWKKPELLWIPTLVRALVLFPIILLSAMGIIQSDIVAYIAVGLLALSNGYVATNSMMLGPQQVGTAQQEHAGNIMAFLLLFGLTIGAIIGEIFPFILKHHEG